MAVGPGDINTRTARNVNLDARWFFSRVWGSGHGLRARSAFGLSVAAVARRNLVSVRASFGVSEERANALVQLRADDVFELAGLRVGLGIFDGKSVLEK